MTTLLVQLPLLDEAPAAEDIKPGWIALVLVIVLCVVTVLPWLSMRKRLRNIRFDRRDDAGDDERPSGQR